MAFLAIFVELSLDMRYTIEMMSGAADQSICDYLKLVDPQADRQDVAANLIGFPTAEQVKQAVQELSKAEVFELVLFEDCMSTLGIRLKLLDSTEDTHHTLIEEGL